MILCKIEVQEKKVFQKPGNLYLTSQEKISNGYQIFLKITAPAIFIGANIEMI